MPNRNKFKITPLISSIIILITFVAVILLFRNYDLFTGKKINNYGKEKVKIGWIGPLSGPVSFIGIENSNSVMLAVEEYNANKDSNAPPVEVMLKDDEYQSDKSLIQYAKMKEEFSPDILFINTYDSAAALSDKIYSDNIISINPIDSDKQISALNRNMFFIAKKTEELGTLYARHLYDEKRYSSVYILTNADDHFMPNLSNSVENSFVKYGGEVVTQTYHTDTTDFRSLLINAKQRNYSAYLFFGYAEIGLAMKQARDLGITAKFYTANLSMKSTAGSAINGVEFADFTELDGNHSKAESFFDRYKERYGDIPQHKWTALQAYDATNIVLKALDNTELEDGNFSENLRKQMYRIDNFEGVSGTLNILTDGSVKGITWNMYTFENNQITKN